MRPLFFLLLSTFMVLKTGTTPLQPKEPFCGYSSCPPADPHALNVHLIPHSHDDLGWLKTYHQYFFQDVQIVISSVIDALNQHPNRTFIQVETAYFKKWWDQQSESTKEQVLRLVNNGQLEMINGGWCMNDEATTNYQSTIDQYTLGLRFLKDNLGECGRPRVSWQIDTFGHSREQASISARLGFDSLFFMRLDYRDQKKRLEERTGDLLWKGSQSLEQANIFTNVFYRNTYAFAPGFCFDIVCQDEPIIEDSESPDYNYVDKINEFADFARAQASAFPTNNILVPMGDDVRYQAAFTNYLNIDRLIKGFELFPQTYQNKPINVFYSTPSCYAKAVNDYVITNNLTLDIKTDDFLPYATDGYGYWSGFYTSRPSTKRFERQGNNFLQIAKQLAAMSGQPYDNKITKLKEAMGVLQHHDAITGTEKQAVLKDYHRMLYEAIEEAQDEVDPALSSLMSGTPGDSFQFKNCLMSNISSCSPSRSSRFTVAVYNPLSRFVTSSIELPVGSTTWTIADPEGNQIDYQVEPTIIDFSYVDNVPTSPNTLTFLAKDLPPLGFKVYSFEQTSSTPRSFGTSSTRFTIDDNTGLLSSVTMNGMTMNLTQDLFYYKSGSYSGAYIFVPLVNEKFRVATGNVKTSAISGSVYQGVVQEFASWAKQVIKVYHEDPSYIEIEWVVGPIDVEGVGKEVVSLFTTSLATDGDFYTDSNGREMLKRTRNHRPTFDYTNEEPIAGNYHPVTSRIVLKDLEQGIELAILTDRTQGATSLDDGQVEVMIQRACPHNDFGKSLRESESINDEEYGQGVIIRGKHYLVLGPSAGDGGKSLAAIQREVALKKLLAPWAFVSNQELSQKLKVEEFSGLKRPLADNVHILTLEPWSDGVVLLRLEHLLEKGEDEALSQEATVDLEDLFTAFTVTELTEMTLGGNMLLEENDRLEWPGVNTRGTTSKVEGLKVTLTPMQIRTFLAKVV